jgi:hypothetical protein
MKPRGGGRFASLCTVSMMTRSPDPAVRHYRDAAACCLEEEQAATVCAIPSATTKAGTAALAMDPENSSLRDLY